MIQREFDDLCKSLKSGSLPGVAGKALTKEQVAEVRAILDYRAQLAEGYFEKVMETRLDKAEPFKAKHFTLRMLYQRIIQKLRIDPGSGNQAVFTYNQTGFLKNISVLADGEVFVPENNLLVPAIIIR